jgi:NAD(P)-dependent dehydrogenase (short-subunit alcohol dehydrogenase family)
MSHGGTQIGGSMKTAVVTGAASGIGAATTAMLLADGWCVYGLDLTSAGLESGERFTPLPCDVRDAEQVVTSFAAAARTAPRLNALVACAGVLRAGRMEAMSVEDFDLIFDVNMRGAWLCAKHALPALKAAAAAGEIARIVFLSSIAALRPKVNGGIYAASKAAVSQMTRVLAVECAPHGVLVNAIAPGTVDTPMIRPAMGRNMSGYRPSGDSPLGRIAQPEDIACMVRLLLSEDAAYVTGATIPVDGGTSAAFVPPGLSMKQTE